MRQRDENLTIRATDLPYERPAAHQAQAGSGGKDKEQDALGRHPRGWNIWLKGAFLTVITHTHKCNWFSTVDGIRLGRNGQEQCNNAFIQYPVDKVKHNFII